MWGKWAACDRLTGLKTSAYLSTSFHNASLCKEAAPGRKAVVLPAFRVEVPGFLRRRFENPGVLGGREREGRIFLNRFQRAEAEVHTVGRDFRKAHLQWMQNFEGS